MTKTKSSTQRSDNTVRDSSHHYYDLFHHAPSGYVCIDLNGVITEANESAGTILGRKGEQLLGLSFVGFIDEKDREIWCHNCLHGKDKNKKKCEMQLVRYDGSEFCAHLDCMIVDKTDSTPQLRIIITDISEYKLIEESLRIAAVAFETQIGIMVTDSTKVILKVNPAFSSLTGYPADELIGKSPSILRSDVHDNDFYQVMWESIMQHGCWQGEIWDVHRSGRPFPVWLTITAIKNPGGRVTHYVGSFTDLTSQKKKQKILLDTKRVLESKITAAHDKIQRISQERSDTKIALEVLLKQLQTTMANAQSQLSVELEKTVLPFLKKIRTLSQDKSQLQLINVLESNLEHLVQSYGRSTNLTSIYQKLTPAEIQVATMVRQGLPTKSIASALNLSSGTITTHRKSIRKKIGLEGKATNLTSYLQSFSEENG